METLDAIRARRNVRTFQDRPIPREHLHLILEAAWRTPSSKNEQRWDFILCTDREQLQRLSTVWVFGGHIAGSAATIALIAPQVDDQPTRESIRFDLGQASMSIMLAAADLGVGSCHSGVGDEALARGLLGYPGGRTCSMLISLGYPADRPLRPIKRPARRPFDEVVHFGRW